MMGLIKDLWTMWLNHYNERRRKIDMDILWPSCCELAEDLNHAKAAFAAHAFNDPAWMALGHDEVYRRIDGLKPPAGSFGGTDVKANK